MVLGEEGLYDARPHQKEGRAADLHVLGLGEQELTAQSTAIRGTLTYVNYRTQLDLPFSGAMKLGRSSMPRT